LIFNYKLEQMEAERRLETSRMTRIRVILIENS
jgi:hypothetical protein